MNPLAAEAVLEAPEKSQIELQDWRAQRRLIVYLVRVGADVSAMILSLIIGFHLRHALGAFLGFKEISLDLYSIASLLFLFPIGYAAVGLYPGYGLSPVEKMRRKVVGTSMMFLGLIAWEWVTHRAFWSRGLLVLTMFVAVVLVPVIASLARVLLRRLGLWGAPVLVLGAGKSGALVTRSLRNDPVLGLIPVGFLDDDPGKQGMVLEGLPVFGGISAARDFLKRGVRHAVLAMPGAGPKRTAKVLGELPFPHVIVVPNLFGSQSLWVSARDLGGILALEVRKNLLLRRNIVIKRVLDYALAIPVSLVSWPIIGLFAFWIKRVSPGPAFYAQEREGLHGRRIRVWKLRTMYPDAEDRLESYLSEHPEARSEWDTFFKLKNDPRVIKGIGRFLRQTSLDELPQLFNVLKGEMSLVGPRPFPWYHLEKFSPEFRSLRRSVLPGVTGLWQISARSEGDLKVQEDLDAYYIRNWYVWLDIYILARTVSVVLSRKGAY